MGKYNKFKVNLASEGSTHTKILNMVGKDKTVLDIGCASGYLSEALRDHFSCKVWGLDRDEQSLKLAKDFCEDTFLANLDNDELQKVLKGKTFQVAVLADVLEHLRNPRKVLESLVSHIDEYLVISVPNISHEAVVYELLKGEFNYRSLGLLDNTHIHFFTLDSITSVLEDLGFTIEKIEKIQIPAEASEFKTSIEDYPEGIRAYVDSLPHSKDYQYIIRAAMPHPGSRTVNLKTREFQRREEGLTSKIDYLENQVSALSEELADAREKSVGYVELLDWQKVKARELNGIFYKKRQELDELEENRLEIDKLRLENERQRGEIENYRTELSQIRMNTRYSSGSKFSLSGLSPISILKNKNRKRFLVEHRVVPPKNPKVAIFSLSYNSERWIPNYLDAVKSLRYPPELLSLHILDNASADGSNQLLLDSVNQSKDYKFPVLLHKSESNLGFAGGNNFLLDSLVDRDFDYVFLLNIDSEIDKDCISHLVEAARGDASIGMVEARQMPKEHPKWYNPVNFETGWCSGGGVLIKKEALDRVGFFDERFFLYCEDVDLSWRMWLAGYRCLFCPEATYFHYTEDLDQEKDLSVQTYYSIRNSFYMHFKYDSVRGIRQHIKEVDRIIGLERDLDRKKLLQKAKRNALKNAPRFLKDRVEIQTYPAIPWAVFNGFNYEKRREFVDTPDGKRKIVGM